MAAKKRSRKEAKQAEESKVEYSEGHVCFGAVVQAGSSSSKYEELRSVDPDEATSEYFTDPTGTILYRADAGAKIEKQVGGRLKGLMVRDGAQMVVTGVYQIVDWCRQVRCQPPGITRDKYNEREKKREANQQIALKRAGRATSPGRSQEGGGQSMKGQNGMSLAENWSELFAENEKLAKKGKALTDDDLKKKMYEQFPDKKGKTTIERVTMIRGIYNKGTSIFAKFGAAGTPKRPKSYRYDDGSTKIEGRAPRAASTKKSKSKSKTAGKTASKKATAKKSGSRKAKRTSKKKSKK